MIIVEKCLHVRNLSHAACTFNFVQLRVLCTESSRNKCTMQSHVSSEQLSVKVAACSTCWHSLKLCL